MSNEELFAGIDSLVYTLNNKKVKSINFDNAATTPPLKCVLDEIVGLSNYYASIGRGVGQKAEITTRLYNMSREYLLNYFNIVTVSYFRKIIIVQRAHSLRCTLLNYSDIAP